MPKSSGNRRKTKIIDLIKFNLNTIDKIMLMNSGARNQFPLKKYFGIPGIPGKQK